MNAPPPPSPGHRALVAIAAGLVIGWVGWAFYDGVASLWFDSANAEYRRGVRDFKDGEYDRALAAFERAVAHSPDFAAARLGRAQSLAQLRRREEALAAYGDLIAALSAAPADDDDARSVAAVAFATRGILLDQMRRHQEALADYKRALSLNPELADGPGWITRLLRKQGDKPPTILDRARYLEAQFALPADQRVLLNPEEDAKQRPYTL
jgi:tetratricopeptide (TPR) repeat protein